MDSRISDSLSRLKEKYKADGFIVLGVFGSYARGEETDASDIDILYALSDVFYEKYPGWKAATAILQIKEDFEKTLGKKVDVTDKDALREVGKKFILPETQYV